MRPASWEVPGPLTLNHSRPPSDSNRIALDHGRACGCSHSPVRVRPCSAAAAAVHAVASVTKAGEVHSVDGHGPILMTRGRPGNLFRGEGRDG